MMWRQENGKDIRYKQMDSGHLVNAILWMCRSKGFFYEEKDGVRLTKWVHDMAKELRKRHLKEKSAKKKAAEEEDMMIPHEIRCSDSSLYDEICTVCGGTDAMGDDRLNRPCKGVRPK